MLELIQNRINKYHVSLDTVHEFEKSILLDSQVKKADQPRAIFSESSFFVWRILNKYHFLLTRGMRSLFKANHFNDRSVISVLMAPNFRPCFPYFMTSASKSIYLFDAWPNEHETIVRFVNLFGIENVFVSSSQAATMLQAKFETSTVHWIPEGIRPEEYKHYPYERKDIDVIALGRKYEAYHELIVRHLENAHRTYLYEKEKGVIIFPSRKEFVDGLARSRISICVPSSITHPIRSGGIETMTIRYLQSMISKCLVVGKAPQELINLFGYNPVIEIDIDDPVGQLQSIFENFPRYIPQIEKNFDTVIQKHTWGHRWAQIKDILAIRPAPSNHNMTRRH